MYKNAEKVVFPCQWISKENITGYLLKSEINEDEDVLILEEALPGKRWRNEKKIRLFGEIIPVNKYGEVIRNKNEYFDKVNKNEKE
jgi:hypothetical protein